MLKAGNLDLKMLPHRVPSGGKQPIEGFCGRFFLNGVFVKPAKIGPELLKVNGLSCDCMFVLSNVGEGRGLGEGMLNSPLKIAKVNLSWGHLDRIGKDLEPRWGHHGRVGVVLKHKGPIHGDQ